MRLTFHNTFTTGVDTETDPFPLRMTATLPTPLEAGIYEVGVEQVQLQHFNARTLPISFITRCFLAVVPVGSALEVSGVGQDLRSSTTYTETGAGKIVPQAHWLHIPLHPDIQKDAAVTSSTDATVTTTTDTIGFAFGTHCFRKRCDYAGGTMIRARAPITALSLDIVLTSMGYHTANLIQTFGSTDNVNFMGTRLSKTQFPNTAAAPGIYAAQSFQLHGTLVLTPVRTAH